MIERNPKLQEFIDGIAGRKQSDCAARGICVTCGGGITGFRNEISRREYQISGMCQECQDSVFGKD